MRQTRLLAAMVAALGVVLAVGASIGADEGMWTFDNFPIAEANRALGTRIDQAWLDRVRLSSVRFGGCSAGIVSADGLVMTNNHCVATCVANLSTQTLNYADTGFTPERREDEAKCPVVHGARKSSGSRVHDLEKRLAEAQKREVEALEQQTATSEVLRVISQSPTDAQPVFDTIMQSAAALCNARNGLVLQFDGERLHFVAATGWTNVDDVRRLYPRRPDPETVAGRVVLQGAVVHIQDFETDLHISEVARRVALAHGARSGLGVPMVQRGKTIGVISLGKPLPEPFHH